MCVYIYIYDSVIYFSYRRNHCIQNKTLYNGRMLEGFLLLVRTLH